MEDLDLGDVGPIGIEDPPTCVEASKGLFKPKVGEKRGAARGGGCRLERNRKKRGTMSGRD